MPKPYIGASAAALRPRPMRLVGTARAGDDTAIVNQAHLAKLTAFVVGQYDRLMRALTAVQYRRVSGDSVGLSSNGKCDLSSTAMPWCEPSSRRW